MSANPRVAMLLLGLSVELMVPGVQAFRKAAVADAIDWEATVDIIKEVDRTKGTDAFVVFQSSSDVELALVARPPAEKVSLETFKDALRSCGPKKKVCIGFYKINYPIFVGSSTRKEKAILVMAFADKIRIMVKMPVTKFVWPPLKQHLRDIGVAPNAVMELSGSKHIEGLSVDSVWEALAGRASRVEVPEIEAFKKHGEDQIQNALLGGPVVTPVTPVVENGDDDETTPADITNEGVPSTASSGGLPSVAVDPKMIEDLVEKKMKAVEAKVEAIVEAKAKEMAVKAAQDEVGRAIRKLGDKVEDAYTSVGKMWIDKAKR